MTSEDALKKYFGHDSFRDKQKEAVKSLLDKLFKNSSVPRV